MTPSRKGAWMIFAVDVFLYGLLLLMVVNVLAGGEDDRLLLLYFGPWLLVPAITLTIARTRVLKLRLGKEISPPE